MHVDSGPSHQGQLFGHDGRAAYQSSTECEPPAARDRGTSRAASGQIRLTRKTFRVQVLDALRAGAKTDEEICRATGLRGSTVRPRRGELLRQGLIEDSGQVRPTRSGRDAIVWRLCESIEGSGCGSS